MAPSGSAAPTVSAAPACDLVAYCLVRRVLEVWRLLPVAFCTWLGCHALAGLDSLTIGDEDDRAEATTTGRGGAGAAASATSAGGSPTSTAAGGMRGVGGGGGMIPTTDCCVAHPTPGCRIRSTVNSSSSSYMACEYCVCMPMPSCCSVEWTQACADQANNNCPGPCGC